MLPTGKLKVYTFWGLMNSATKASLSLFWIGFFIPDFWVSGFGASVMGP